MPINTCMTMVRSMTRTHDARKALESSVVAKKSLLSLSHVIQSVAMTVITTVVISTEPAQKNRMRGRVWLCQNFLKEGEESQ